MRCARRVAVALLSVAVAGQAYPLDAGATVVNFDEFAVTRDGTTLFHDSFDRNNTLNGGSGSLVSSGTTFSDGTPANYRVTGSIPETTANNGRAQLNTANGILVAQQPPNIPLIQVVTIGLSTGTDPTGPHVLTKANTFSTIGLFDLAVPSQILGTYQFFLSSNTPAAPGREIDLRVRETDAGPVLQLRWVNQANGQNTVINEVALTPAELADPQLELEFAHDIVNSDVVTAAYAFGSGNTLATFNGTLTALGSTDSSTSPFTPATSNITLPGFNAFDPVPEPPSLAILVVGLLGLAALRLPKKQPAMHP